MLKGLFSLVVILSATATVRAQSQYEAFQKALQKNDTIAARNIIVTWEQQEPQNPNLYVAKFNYLIRRAERVELRSGAATKGGFSIQDKKAKTVGSINEGYDPQLMSAAQAALRKGVALAPNRLDMRFGLAKSCELMGDGKQQIEVLSEALAHHSSTAQQWRWFDTADLPAPEQEFVPASLEEYAAVYWQQDQAEALEFGRQLSELIVRYYPKSSLGPFNMGVYYLFKKQAQPAYKFLKQADALQPHDQATVANLTKLAIELKNKAEAQEYLAQLNKMPDAKAAASEYAKELRKLK